MEGIVAKVLWPHRLSWGTQLSIILPTPKLVAVVSFNPAPRHTTAAT